MKYLIKESNITFSNTQMSEEFLSNNYITEGNTPLLRDTNNTIDSNNNNINKTNNYIEKEISKINNDLENILDML